MLSSDYDEICIASVNKCLYKHHFVKKIIKRYHRTLNVMFDLTALDKSRVLNHFAINSSWYADETFDESDSNSHISDFCWAKSVKF